MTNPSSQPAPAIRSISDTALWTAMHRARESERPDALFRDPFARRLAGERGEAVIASMASGDIHDWPWTMRTLVFDEFIAGAVRSGAPGHAAAESGGVDMVINLAAGLDARPYRMDLPPALQWVEVDLPEMIAAKEAALARDRPRCRLERIALDLADVSARRALFEQLGRRARRAMIVTEGLLIYLAPDEVAALAQDLAGPPSFQRWALDLASPGLLRVLQKKMASGLREAGAPFKFGPEEGPLFFERSGWKPLDVRSLLKTAAKHKRLPWLLRVLALLPDSKGRQGGRPWGGVCLMGRA